MNKNRLFVINLQLFTARFHLTPLFQTYKQQRSVNQYFKMLKNEYQTIIQDYFQLSDVFIDFPRLRIYSLGVMPVSFLNDLKNDALELKPHCSARADKV